MVIRRFIFQLNSGNRETKLVDGYGMEGGWSRGIQRRGDNGVARKETMLVYEESLEPRPVTKGVVTVITTRQGGRGGCFGPLRSLLSLFLGECSHHRSLLKTTLALVEGGPTPKGKGMKRDRNRGTESKRKAEQDGKGYGRGTKETMHGWNSTETKL